MKKGRKIKKNLKPYKKWIKNIKFDHIGIEEYKLHQQKSPIFINDIDINKKVVSKKLPFGK